MFLSGPHPCPLARGAAGRIVATLRRRDGRRLSGVIPFLGHGVRDSWIRSPWRPTYTACRTGFSTRKDSHPLSWAGVCVGNVAMPRASKRNSV